MLNLWLAFIITTLIALAWLRFLDYIAHRGFISRSLSRKFVHIGTGIWFVLCWLLFEDVPYSRYVAAIIPLMITIQFVLIGLGILHDPASVDSMSRSGKKEELLRGPLLYGVVFVLLTIVFWRNSPYGIIGLMLLCGGDGFADVVGSRWGRHRIRWSNAKSWEGFWAMLFIGWILSFGMVIIFMQVGYFNISPSSALWLTLIVSFASALVESFPLKEIDNITVPVISVILSYVLGTFVFHL